ncbi:MAG: hypothetical protein Kow0089_02600 [Desulfobulbaceae bacterium]
MTGRKRFTLLEGGRDLLHRVGTRTVEVCPADRVPLPADVRVFEEDTWLVLTASPVTRCREEHPVRVMTELLEARPQRPGSVVTQGNSWYAVVHDLDRDPVTRPEWVLEAYRTALTLAEKKKVRRLALDLLGSVHGTLGAATSLSLLLEAFHACPARATRTIVLPVPRDQCMAVLDLLHRLAP